MNIHLYNLGHGKPVVFFHGFGFDSQVWNSTIPLLSHTHSIYLVDLPGFGQTPNMSWELFKQLLLQQLPEQFAIVGWSMGGLFATRFALEASKRVTHLFNIASSPSFLKNEQWPGIASVALERFYHQLMQNPRDFLQQFIALQMNHSKPQDIDITIPAGLEDGLNVLMNWDLRSQLHQLTIPVCYLFGRLDAIVPHTLMKKMQSSYPQFQYELFLKSAHAPFLSQQDAFVSMLLEYLK